MKPKNGKVPVGKCTNLTPSRKTFQTMHIFKILKLFKHNVLANLNVICSSAGLLCFFTGIQTYIGPLQLELRKEKKKRSQVTSELHNLVEWWNSDGGRLRPGLILISDEAVKREDAAFRALLSVSILMDFLLFWKWEDGFIFTSNHWISVSSSSSSSIRRV